MKSKAIIPLILGLGMGFMAIKLALGMIQRAQADSGQTLGVVVAAAPIEAAARIEKAMLRLAPVPKALVPPGAYNAIEAIAGRVSAMQIATGLPVSAEMLAPAGSEPGMASQVPIGYRAISVRTDEASSVAGFVMPGARVDIYAVDNRFERNTGVNRPVSRMLLEDVQVAAVGQSTKMADADGKTTRLVGSVTLYVKPEDLPALDVASRETIRLVLRGSRDRKQNLVAARDSLAKGFESLFSGWQVRTVETPRAKVTAEHGAAAANTSGAALKPEITHTVEIYHGVDVERITFGGPHLSERVDASRSQRTKM